MSGPEHGSRARYLKGCHCPACSRAHYAYSTRREQGIVRGDWRPWTDAERAREHAAALEAAGMTVTNIARAADVIARQSGGSVRQGTVYRLLGKDGRPSSRLRPVAAAAILAVRPDLGAVPGGVVDATGTRRRIQALIAAGWTQNRLAAELGVKPENLSAMLRGVRGQHTVRAATAAGVRSLYDRLWNQAPPQDTPRAAAQAKVARRNARERGWAPPLGWDDDRIDDPAAEPEPGWERPVHGLHRGPELVEDLAEVTSQGFTLTQAAERLGVSRAAAEKAVERYGRTA